MLSSETLSRRTSIFRIMFASHERTMQRHKTYCRISEMCTMWIICLVGILRTTVPCEAKLPLFIKRPPQYTPLLFFKVPLGMMPECDIMEKRIKSLEKETGIHVQQLDVMRDRAAKKLYEKIVEGNPRLSFPVLYHRESLQRVYGIAEIDLVRSWSKGRLLADQSLNEKMVAALGSEDHATIEREEIDLEELEMEMDQELTPMQRRGKEAMKRRMEDAQRK